MTSKSNGIGSKIRRSGWWIVIESSISARVSGAGCEVVLWKGEAE